MKFEGYDAPITLVTNGINTQIEGEIMKAVMKCDVLVDREELIKALAYDRGQYNKGYADGKRDAIRHGHWNKAKDFTLWCSECTGTAPYDTNYYGDVIGTEKYPYCPHCGAKMDEVEKGLIKR